MRPWTTITGCTGRRGGSEECDAGDGAGAVGLYLAGSSTAVDASEGRTVARKITATTMATWSFKEAIDQSNWKELMKLESN